MNFFKEHRYPTAWGLSIIIICILAFSTAPAFSVEQECTNTTHSLFSDSSDERTVEFLDGGGTNITSKMVLPQGADVVSASAHLVGSPKVLSEDRPIDVVLVNDVSASMEENCHCADGTPSLNGYCNASQGYPYHPDYPCKIEDMKNASIIFSNAILAVPDNTEGLVSYSTKVKSFLGLTDNISAVEEEIDDYTAGGHTCISCGIRKAVELLASGTNDDQFIVLMSDGVANYCIPGSGCGEEIAKQEAIYEAWYAYDTYGIRVFTIAFGEDADNVTMQSIAGNASGEYYFAGETDIEDVYLAIAGIITSTYPTNPYLDVGSNGIQEWNWSGPFNTADDASDYSAELESILALCNCPGCTPSGDDCIVDFELYSDTSGFITINTTVVTQVCVECEDDDDCDDLDDECNDGVCTDNECFQVPKTVSTPCELDQDPCTLDHCDGSGSCVFMDWNPECAIYDFGDAPDNSNTHSNPMTAYPPGGPGIAANYPTVHWAGSPPFGPCHTNYFAVLGQEISLEMEADLGADMDVVNNIWPPTDTPDQDSVLLPFTMDDGLKHVPINPMTNALNLLNCQVTSIPVEVSITGGPYSTDWDAYLNIWIDYTHDGDWADSLTCYSTDDAPEWVVQNYVVASLNAGGYGPGTFTVTPTFMGYNPSPPQEAWMRVQLTEVPVQHSDGSGPDYCYEDGETEDYYVVIIGCEVDDDCDFLDSPCTDGVCIDSACIPDHKPPSTPCEADGDFCTVDHCDGSGSCVFEENYDCSDGVDCTEDVCNELTDSCENNPDDDYCDDGQFCNGDEYCDPVDDCQPGTPIDCSPYNLPEISQCDHSPEDDNPFTWDFAPGFTSVCDEDADDCTQGSHTFTHQCRDNDMLDGVDVHTCGAECDQHTDCVCPEDGCIGDNYYDYPDFGTCMSDCTCVCDPDISYSDERCIRICERDGQFGEGHEYICHGDGTYDRCREDGTGYDYVYECMEECSASPECDGYIPNFYFVACDIYGQDYLQDYCDGQCQIRDDNCESSYDFCTADPECDEVVPGTHSCTYQCEYKPEICYIDGIWGDKPHQYVCLEDNTYLECIDLGSGYGIEYEHVNICSYLCTGSIECDGLPPGTELESCDQYGEDYLQDYCDENCIIQDDDCESDFDCTADPQCDEASPNGLLVDGPGDTCDAVCVYHYCGDEIVDEVLGEECDPDAHNSIQCPQQAQECDWDRHKLGLRDSLGDCTGCLCVDDGYEYDCVVGECGALCNEDADCESFCTDDILSYNGQCDLFDECACSYDTEDCNDYDNDYFVDFHCDVSSGDIWNWYEDWICEENGEADCAYSEFDWKFDIHEDCIDDCSDTDGGIEFDIQGTVTDRELCDDEGQTACPEYHYTDYCTAQVLTEYYCDGGDVTSTTLDCDSLDWYDDYVYYCDGDDVRRHRQFHDFSCTPGGCSESVSWTDDELVEECLYDGWYNYGDDPGLDDPECEYRDYTCVEDTQADCGYGVTESHDYDDQDGSYCIDSEGVEDRDYYCDASGTAQYVASDEHDCGDEAWSGGGNTPGFGDDPACTYTDYFCVDDGVDDYCSSDNPYSDDFDSMDVTECDGPMLLGDHDYWCDLGTCDSGTPSNGCSPGDTWYDLRCDQSCGAECDEDSDCDPNSCSVEYFDYCDGMKLNEYDDDHVLDSTTVEDECDNTCDTDIAYCSCSDCGVDCSPPQVNAYCVEGVCGAECDSDDDCPPYLDDSICHYDRPCESDCGCGPGSEEYCPLPGTVEQGVCYYGVRDCIDIEGCTLETCVLEPGQYCDPMEGCSDVECIDIDPITLFHDGSGEKVIEYPSGGGSDSSAKARVPKDLVVFSATVNLTGEPVSFTEDRILDFLLVNDVSGSMDDNCYCADGTPSINGWCSESQGYPYHPGYPCKIEDMKNASTIFSNTVLAIPGNMIGLVSYSSKLKSFIDLTDNLVVIETEIDSYKASGQTCISCGIRKGIDIVNAGSNIPVIILMTDGNANRCFAGVNCCGGDPDCGPAKAEALSEAQRAWDDYGISIITVGFGDDADEDLLQEIANVSGNDGGLGSYYFAPETDLVDIYHELATLLTQVFPTDPSLDAGSDGMTEWDYSGEFMVSETANFTDGLQDVLDCTCPGCVDEGDTCLVDLELLSTTAGILIANNLEILGCIPEIPEIVACSSCQDCGGGEDCQSEGPWSDWGCVYDDICDESGDCSRSRTVITYSCVNPGTEGSYCDSSSGPEYDYDTQYRETDGTLCDDGLWCTDPDACSQGVCTGPDRDCGDDVCDEDLDACVENPGEEDSDQDGVPDTEDECPETWGDYCRGCPEPACTGCAIPDCPVEGPPVCTGDDGECPDVACPADDCGLDTCEPYEWADYLDTVESVCIVDGLSGSCTTPTCDGTATCTPDVQCGWEGEECEPTNHIVISEVMYDSPLNEPYGEWVELYNPTGSDVDLTNWRIYDNVGWYLFFQEGTIIGAGEYMSIAHYDGDSFFDLYGCYPHLDDFTRPLSNTGDYLSLRDNTMTEVDYVSWGVGYWEIFASEGKSIMRDPSYCDTDEPGDWLSDQEPTPACNPDGEAPEGFCIVIDNLQVLNSDFNPVSEIEPGAMYHIEVTSENICEEDISLLQIVDVTDSGNSSIGYGTIKYEIHALDTAVTTLGFLLPGDATGGEEFDVTVLNWNHWITEGPDPWESLSEPGYTQFSASGGT